MSTIEQAVTGHVATGFEPVRDTFTHLTQTGRFGEGGAAYAVWHDGRLVVDLWAGMAAPGRPWEASTRNTWMSTGKAVTAVCVQMAHDRGLFDLDEPVATYWPAFAAAGKQDITVRQVLAHTAGVLGSPKLTAVIDHDACTGFEREDEILDAITSIEPAWEPGTRTGYHCFTYSWILSELLRRTDGRGLGDFLREEIAEPLDVADVRIGTPDDALDGIAEIAPTTLLPDDAPEPVADYTDLLLATARDASTPAGLAFLAHDGRSVLDRLPAFFNQPAGLRPELGGSNMTGTARGVAKIFGALARPDGIDGVRLASEASLATFSEVSTDQVDACLHLPINRALGYWRNIPVAGRPQACGPNPETVLHTGMGGQLGFADPVARVGGAFTRNHHTHFQVEGLLLNNTLYACLGA